MGYRLYWPAGVRVSARASVSWCTWYGSTHVIRTLTRTRARSLSYTHTEPFRLHWNSLSSEMLWEGFFPLFYFLAFFFLPLSFFSFLSSFFVFFSLLCCYLPSSSSVNFLHIIAIRQMRKFFCLSTFFYEQIKVASHYHAALRAMHLMTSTKTFADVVAAANPGTHLFCFYLLGELTCSMPHASWYSRLLILFIESKSIPRP